MQKRWYLISPKNPQSRDSNTSKNYRRELDGNHSSVSSLTLPEEEVGNVVLAEQTSHSSECRKNPNDHQRLSTVDDNKRYIVESNNNNKNETIENNLKLIEETVNNVLALQSEIVAFSGSQEDKKYLYLEDTMVRNLVLLDGIESNNNEDVKFKRKEAVGLIQQHINLLDAKTTENVRLRSEINKNQQFGSKRDDPPCPRQRTTLQDMVSGNWLNYTMHNSRRQNYPLQNTIFHHWDEGNNSNYAHVPGEVDEDDVDFEL